MKYIQSEDKKEYIQNYGKTEDKPVFIITLVNDVNQSLPDVMIQKFVDFAVEEATLKMEETGQVVFNVDVANMHTFDCFRVALSLRELTDILFVYEGVMYDLVRPNGKIVNDSLPKDLHDEISLHMAFLMEVL